MVKILLVEDNEVIRATISDLIGMEDNFSVEGQAANGKIALALIQDGLTVDIVITDLNMPEMDGIELTQNIIAMNKDIKVIILTMHDKQTYLDRAFAAGAKGYLLKNGDMDELYSAIEKVYNGESIIGLSE
ncbi:response regulator [Pedobacter steynii]|uniref:Response regulatory domain-containing protein n=1 Tax=Pedobacter steynii TaxID=430522 RepID=A0A1D7QLU5_9SPHI|nr:response regulator transcription factor [Pedobacter steynii]AOM79644.1 hypothetical protein BFS30_22285 [Pedobacter steynii]